MTSRTRSRASKTSIKPEESPDTPIKTEDDLQQKSKNKSKSSGKSSGKTNGQIKDEPNKADSFATPEIESKPKSRSLRVKSEPETTPPPPEAPKKEAKATPKKRKLKESSVEAEKQAPTKSPKRTKRENAYGVTLGTDPFPDWHHPTPAEAKAVHDALSEQHGYIRVPASIPVPSRTFAGCGEVRFALEALIRTIVSAHTSGRNAGFAIQGIISKYGVFESGPTKGCINWDKVRRGTHAELETAIQRGGLFRSKAKSIKSTLDMVYAENEALREKLKADPKAKLELESIRLDPEEVSDGDSTRDTKAAKAMTGLARDILTNHPEVLTIDYLHGLPAPAAFNHMLSYAGVGVKTAACTLLFCMRRPVFAVDTHVFRLCVKLGWMPDDKRTNRETCFAHCDVRIPPELKYALHVLFIKHGKSCPSCKAEGRATKGKDFTGCPIRDLVVKT